MKITLDSGKVIVGVGITEAPHCREMAIKYVLHNINRTDMFRITDIHTKNINTDMLYATNLLLSDIARAAYKIIDD